MLRARAFRRRFFRKQGFDGILPPKLDGHGIIVMRIHELSGHV